MATSQYSGNLISFVLDIRKKKKSSSHLQLWNLVKFLLLMIVFIKSVRMSIKDGHHWQIIMKQIFRSLSDTEYNQ